MEEHGGTTQGIMHPPVDPDGRMQRWVTSERVLMSTGRQDRSFDSTVTKSATNMASGKGAEIMLRFQVDPQTRQVTIFVLDKTHRNVIRTIPPEEMARLKVGEIVDLFV